MPIEATCPNGHHIQCPDEAAGRTARCPKCAAAFRIPTPSTITSGAAPGSSVNSGIVMAEAAPTIAGVATMSAGFHDPLSGLGGESGSSGEPIVAKIVETGSGSSLSGNGAAVPNVVKAHAEQIIFLCPNGHKLNGPAKLAGRLGKCPHCDMRFQIPSLEELREAQTAAEREESAQSETEATGQMPDNGSENETYSVTNTPDLNAAASSAQDELETLFAAVRADQVRQIHQRTASASGIGKTSGISSVTTAPGILPQPLAGLSETHHPLADLVNRLWEEREHGGIIELHLEGGTLFLPDWFERTLSNKSHGLFAAQAADGTVTMTVVPWDKVARVVIRGVVGLPDGMFE